MVVYNGPIEEEVVDPSEEFLKDIFFKKDKMYWKQGGGDSCIEIDGCEERLIFFYDDPYGFFIMRHPDYLVKVNKNIKKIQAIEHLVGGEPMRVPTCSYLSRESAYHLVKNFIQKKEFNEEEWKDLYDIEFEHEFED